MPDSRRNPRGRRRQVRVAHRSAGRPVRRGIRWERIPAVWLTALVLVMAMLYVPRVHSFMSQRSETAAQKEQLRQLGKENRALRKRTKALRRNATIELEARKLGMVKADERPYVIVE